MERPIHERHLGGGIENVAEGYNLKLDGTQAAVILAKLPHLDRWAALRRNVAELYAERLAPLPDVVTPAPPANGQHAWRNYVIQVPPARRDVIRQQMAQRGVTTATLYAPPVHLQPVYGYLGLKRGAFPVAETLADSLLALPIYPGMTAEQVNYVVEALQAAMMRKTD
jgi:dTDP-4-amino-4,6-dideoxygalactose transaminase